MRQKLYYPRNVTYSHCAIVLIVRYFEIFGVGSNDCIQAIRHFVTYLVLRF